MSRIAALTPWGWAAARAAEALQPGRKDAEWAAGRRLDAAFVVC